MEMGVATILPPPLSGIPGLPTLRAEAPKCCPTLPPCGSRGHCRQEAFTQGSQGCHRECPPPVWTTELTSCLPAHLSPGPGNPQGSRVTPSKRAPEGGRTKVSVQPVRSIALEVLGCGEGVTVAAPRDAPTPVSVTRSAGRPDRGHSAHREGVAWKWPAVELGVGNGPHCVWRLQNTASDGLSGVP